MLAMFKNVNLPTDKRALELLERINSLWEENAWLAGKSHQRRHMEVSSLAQRKIVELVSIDSDAVEEILNDEICIHQFVEWALQGSEEEEVDI